MTSDLPVPAEQLVGEPLLSNQRTPADFAHYIAARTSKWKASRNAGQSPPA